MTEDSELVLVTGEKQVGMGSTVKQLAESQAYLRPEWEGTVLRQQRPSPANENIAAQRVGGLRLHRQLEGH